MKVKIKYPESTCKWCGTNYTKKHNRQEYCSDYCRTEAKKEQNRNNFHKWYHKNKHKLSSDKRYGLGSGYLKEHPKPTSEEEHRTIRNELHRLRIKKS